MSVADAYDQFLASIGRAGADAVIAHHTAGRELASDFAFRVGDPVKKDSGDYRFFGWVVSCYRKRSGAKRYVVENADGMNFIFNESQLIRWEREVA